MIHYDMPLITGSVENQLKMLKSFLFQQTEKMNYNLDMTTPEKFWQTTVDAIANADNEQEEDVYRSSYTSLKSLIIKSATEVLKTEQTFSQVMEGQYIAKSDFGTYFEKATVNIDGNPYGITQLYNYSAEIKTALGKTNTNLEQTKTGLSTTNENLNKAKTELSTAISNVSNELSDYKVKTSHYIKEGYLDTTTSNPVFGVEIGLLESVFTYEGKEISNSVPKKIRITPDKMSFFSSVKESNSEKTKNIEVAYIEENAIYFPNAQITGGTLDIGNKTFYVDNNGNMTATSGRIGDWSITSTGGIQYHVGDKTFAEGGYYIFSPHGHGVAHSICGSPSTTDWILSISNTFGVTGAGKLYAEDAVVTGNVTASSGEIGGWTITGAKPDARLYYGTWGTDNSAMLCPSGSSGSKEIGGSDLISGWTITSGANFGVTKNGTLYASNAKLSGNITATSGEIGGWIITGAKPDARLYYGTWGTDNSAMLCPSGSSGSKEIGGSDLISGWTITSGADFGVTKNGTLYASNAKLSGNITATSGRIGDWSITGTGGIQYHIDDKTFAEGGYYIFSPHGHGVAHSICGSPSTTDWILSISNTFGVTGAGKLYAENAVVTGNITASSGEIGGWTITGAKPDARLYYGTWGTDNSAMLCPSGSSGSKKIGGSDSISGWTITSGANFGVTNKGTMYAVNAKIQGSITSTNPNETLRTVISSGIIQMQKKVGSSWSVYGMISSASSGGQLYLYGPAGIRYDTLEHRFDINGAAIMTLSNVSGGSGEAGVPTLDATNVDFIAGSFTKKSDKRLKKDIAVVGDKQEQMFALLNPVTFKYIDGTSGRTHFGFIAQEVRSAAESAGLTTQDVAAFVEHTSNAESKVCMLRYDEFIALNCHMIQKCLKEIATLKAEIQILKQKG